MQVGRVYLVGAGPGDPGLLTLKAKAILERADVVAYDRLVSSEILNFARDEAELLYVGKASDHHELSQADIHRLLVERARFGLTVVRLKGGDPFVFGRGGEEAEALHEHGIPFEIVPGVSSVAAVPAYAGIPLTHRAFASGFQVLTGHNCGELPDESWKAAAASGQTLVVVMGIGHLREIAQRLICCGRGEETPVAVVRWGTTAVQETVTGSLKNIADRVEAYGLTPPSLIIVGEVVRLHEKLNWFAPALSARSSGTAR